VGFWIGIAGVDSCDPGLKLFDIFFSFFLYIQYIDVMIRIKTMAKKVRLWVCPCCRKFYPRKKSVRESPYTCALCGHIKFKKGIKYPEKNYYNYKCKHRRKRAAAEKFKKDYYLKPRNLGGQVLKISPDTMKAFRSLRAARRFDSFERRANIFLQLLYKDMTNYPDDCYRKYVDKADYSIKKAQGGVAIIPVLKVMKVPDDRFYHTIYDRANLIKVFEIMISKNLIPSSPYMYNSLFKQVLYWIESLQGHSHGEFFSQLKWFQKKFNIIGGA